MDLSHLRFLLLIVPLFLISGAIHECAHAWAAYRLGDPTAKMMGRLTLDPRPHIDPLGLVMIILGFLFSGFLIGWMKPVPVNNFNFRHQRRDFALVALSGPGSNLIQATIWYVLFLSLRGLQPALSGEMLSTILTLCVYGVILNMSLIVFNLIPVPPLDGSRVLAWLLPSRYAVTLDRMEQFGILILLVLLWTGIIRLIFGPVLNGALWLFPGIPSFMG